MSWYIVDYMVIISQYRISVSKQMPSKRMWIIYCPNLISMHLRNLKQSWERINRVHSHICNKKPTPLCIESIDFISVKQCFCKWVKSESTYSRNIVRQITNFYIKDAMDPHKIFVPSIISRKSGKLRWYRKNLSE